MIDAPLKLAATDSDDISVLSALLQDAIIPIAEMAYLPAEDRFALVANRFRWENADDEKVPGRIYERVKCGVVFDRVTGVRRRAFDPKRRSQVFELLAIETGEGYADLLFAGGAEIRVEMEEILCHADDFGDPWPTQWRPEHETDEETSA